ncbi:MAG TPA: peptidase dimerization domain-containing protein, partial [Polyangiaceae bacterium]|nr:peptidase dimerization domain-containing protein [Polyangiaceae bacterium]
AVIEHNPDMAAVAHTGDAAAAARLSEKAYYNALLHTTCVATLLEGGHAENALPQSARATINCRILPGVDPARVEETLRGALGDPQVELRRRTKTVIAAPPSPLAPETMRAVESITQAMWPGVPALPVMLNGATDGALLRNAGIACYGISGEFGDIDDVRAHGKDERVLIRSFYDAREFLDRLVRKLARGS